MLSDDLVPQYSFKYKCLDLLVYALTYVVRKRHAHNVHIRTNRIYQYADYGHVENICAYAQNRICRYPHETAWPTLIGTLKK